MVDLKWQQLGGAEAGESLYAQHQCGLHIRFQAIQSYTVRLSPNKTQTGFTLKKKKKGWIQSSVNWCQVTVKASDTFAILRKYSITDPHGQALESTIHFKILTLKVFHAFMCTTCVQKSERGVRSLGTSIIDGWQPLMIQLLWVLEIELRSSARVISILNPGPFLQPQVLKECLQLLCLGLGQHMVSINCNLCLQEKDEPDRWT